MALSSADKAIAESAYARIRKKSLFPGVCFGAIIAIIGPPLMKDFHHAQPSQSEIMLYCVLAGFGIGCAFASFFISRQRKQDLEIVRFFEKHFPDECSWKQEEQILAAAEDLRLKAKVHSLIHSDA